MNARILRMVVLGTLATALAWAVLWWPRAPALALAAVLLTLCWPGLQLLVQMLLMRRVARAVGATVAPWPTVAAAWAAEWRLALQVFGWRLPFRVDAQADGWPAPGAPPAGQVALVMVHGFFCNRAVWAPWLARLRRQGIACAAMTLEPAHGAPIDAMVADLDACVRRMAQASGRAPLIVAHSMGGLVVRAWLKGLEPAERQRLVAHVVTLATPHRGTWMARFAHSLPARDMRQSSDWLERLGPPPADVAFSCWWSACDNIVFPAPAATLPGHDAHGLDDVAHVQLVFDARVWRFCLRLRRSLQRQADLRPALAR